MNELENQLAEIIKKALAAAEKSGEFVIDQAPQLLQEFYHWHIVQSLFFIIMFLTFMIITYRIKNVFGVNGITNIDEDLKPYYFKKADGKFHKANYKDGSENFSYVFKMIFKYGSLLWLIGIVINIYKLVFIVVAPKIYLIEYFIK